MKKLTTKGLVVTASIAAIYVVVTIAFAFMSYDAVQFRISEVMVLLAFIDPGYLPGLVLGCFIANLLGPFGIIDAIIGGFATFVSVFMIIKSRNLFKNQTLNLFIASLWPAVFSFIIASEIYFTGGGSFWYWTVMVAIGELVVITGVGFPLFKYILSKPEWVEKLTIQKEFNNK